MLIANIEDGKLYRLRRDGQHEVVLDAFDGRPLGRGQFRLSRSRRRPLWITVSTRTVPRREAVERAIPDGYILLLERRRRARSRRTASASPTRCASTARGAISTSPRPAWDASCG